MKNRVFIENHISYCRNYFVVAIFEIELKRKEILAYEKFNNTKPDRINRVIGL